MFSDSLSLTLSGVLLAECHIYIKYSQRCFVSFFVCLLAIAMVFNQKREILSGGRLMSRVDDKQINMSKAAIKQNARGWDDSAVSQ